MSQQEKKWQRIYDLVNAETKPNFICLPNIKQRKLFFFFTEKKHFKEKGELGIKQKTKRRLFNCSRYGD